MTATGLSQLQYFIFLTGGNIMKNKFVKKLISVVLVGAMMTLGIVGCGNSNGAATADGTTEKTEEVESSGDGKLPLEGVTLTFTGDAFNPYRIIGSDGSLTGYDADVLAALQKKLGFKYKFVEAEFAAVLTSVSSGTADFAMTLTPKEERKESFDFTQEYIQPKTGVGTLPDSDIKSWEDLKGKTVIAPSATTFAETAYAIEGANVIEMENIPLGCEEVKAGRADAVLCDSVQLGIYAEEYGFNEIVVTQEETGVPMLGNAMGFTKGSKYVKYFDQALTELKEDGTLTELQKKWLGEENATVY